MIRENNSYPETEPRAKALDNHVRVSTPENIAFHYEVIGPSKRLIAFCFDIVFAGALYFGIFLVCAALYTLLAYLFRSTALTPLLEVLAELIIGVLIGLLFFWLWFYGAYMETYFNGQTFGKKLLNIRTISSNGSAIDGVQATLRNFFRLLDVAPIVSLGLFFGPDAGYSPIVPTFAFGLICMAVSPKFQRIGDLVAGTIVVTEEKKWTHGLAQFQDPRIPDLADLIPESFTPTPTLAQSLADYVDRRRVLPPQRLAEVANYLGKPLLKIFSMPSDTSHDLLLCALYYKIFIGKQQKPIADKPFIENGNSSDFEQEKSTGVTAYENR